MLASMIASIVASVGHEVQRELDGTPHLICSLFGVARHQCAEREAHRENQHHGVQHEPHWVHDGLFGYAHCSLPAGIQMSLMHENDDSPQCADLGLSWASTSTF